MNFQDVFFSRLSKRPYCSDDCKNGLIIKYKDQAIKYPHIQIPNSKIAISSMVFDIDYQDAAYSWEKANLATPTWISINPETKHAHIGYMLESPVYTGVNASLKAISYFKNIRYCYSAELNADIQYRELITKNPFHKKWDNIVYGKLYSLNELAEYVDLKNPKHRTNLIIEGRNCLLFEELRHFAYSVFNKYKNDLEKYLVVLEQKALIINKDFPMPLELSEVRIVVKSIYKYVVRNFNKEKLSENQKKVRLYVGKRTCERIQAFPTETVENVSEMLNISKRTVYRHKEKKIKQTPWIDLGISRATYYRKRNEIF
jgi:hypothetical protein